MFKMLIYREKLSTINIVRKLNRYLFTCLYSKSKAVKSERGKAIKKTELYLVLTFSNSKSLSVTIVAITINLHRNIH